MEVLSLSLSRGLVDAGIEVKTEFSYMSFRGQDTSVVLTKEGERLGAKSVCPAPDFTELWNILPTLARQDSKIFELMVRKWSPDHKPDITYTHIKYVGSNGILCEALDEVPVICVAQMLLKLKTLASSPT